jgi:hypothetical protein
MIEAEQIAKQLTAALTRKENDSAIVDGLGGLQSVMKAVEQNAADLAEGQTDLIDAIRMISKAIEASEINRESVALTEAAKRVADAIRGIRLSSEPPVVNVTVAEPPERVPQVLQPVVHVNVVRDDREVTLHVRAVRNAQGVLEATITKHYT